MEQAIDLEVGKMTGVTLSTPHGVVFQWTEPDRVGVGDETDFPLEEKEKGGKRPKVVVEHDMGDDANRLRRLMGQAEQITRKAVNKGGSHKTSLMCGSVMSGEAYPEMTIHKMARLPPDETVEATGQTWNPLSHTYNLEATAEAGYPFYELRTVRVNGKSVPVHTIANSKGGMDPPAFKEWISHCVVPAHPSLHEHLDFDEPVSPLN